MDNIVIAFASRFRLTLGGKIQIQIFYNHNLIYKILYFIFLSRLTELLTQERYVQPVQVGGTDHLL